ncbi:MAG TPA: DUF6600 domain-containing protein [Casimicrobiaceae bacterium]|nr:DUF6600 domain-containing protein [Casimicrobiaceae bacterium]
MKPLSARFIASAKRCTMVAVLTLAAPALAQVNDLPGRVGRLSDLGGRVYLSAEDRATDWIEAARNHTVTSGDNLWVTRDGRAEVDYGGGQFRLSGETNLHIARLDDRTIALFVAHGRVIVRVRVLDSGDSVRIDTPNTQIGLTRPGLYRIEVSDDRARSTVIVREGEATASVAAGVQQILPGQVASIVGDQPDYAEVRSGYGIDGFDTWNAERDRRYERSRSANYVSRQMIGYADLDDHGTWHSSSEYGMVWYPTSVAADWAPYRYGRWTWVGDYGWTWADDAPWGYAPFHYGRWVHVGNRWGWCPGTYVARPAWAPALVAWHGGSGWSASVHFGAPVYGWVPLAWGEPYLPSWRHCSDRCWTRYNRPYAVNRAERPHAPPTRYINWTAPGGVTAVAGATFTGRKPVHANLVDIRTPALANAPVLAHAPVLQKPTAATVPGARPTFNAPPPAVALQNKPMVIPSVGTTPTWGDGNVARPSLRPPAESRAVPPAAAVAPAPRAVPPAVAPSGTWGSPVPRAAIPHEARPDARVQNRAEASRYAAPGAPSNSAQRAVPPAAYIAPAPPTAVPPATRAAPYVPPLPAATAPTPASAPAPQIPVRPAPQLAPVPSPVPHAAPAPVPPQESRAVPREQRPVPQRDGDKPVVQR